MSPIKERAENARPTRIRATAVMVWLIAGTFAAYAVPAHADWQYTKWGMSPEDALTAAAGKAKVAEKPTSSPSGEVDKLTVSYTAGDYEFTGLFRFDRADKLVAVQLLLHGPANCDRLRDELIAKYGSPARTATTSLSKEAAWLDTAEDTKVLLMDLGPGTLCSLEYSPLSNASRKGL